MRRKNTASTPPKDFGEATEGFKRFTKFEMNEGGILEGLQIPSHLYLTGKAIHVLYRSDKWEKKSHDYIHEHEAGVKIYEPGGAFRVGPLRRRGGALLREDDDRYPLGEKTAVPKSLEPLVRASTTDEATSIYLLGECLGFTYEDDDGLVEVKTAQPYPELYSVPSGKALLVIDVSGSKAKLLFAIWGGGLDVKPEGIVG